MTCWTCQGLKWHQRKDSNPDKQFWRLPCYRYTTLIMAESQGVEPCDPFYLIYGLANRCITVLPTLHKLAAPHGFEPQ